jgi:[methyl-Co(III) methanol-specific corrinoid protein]:coenzyme M methyltransferase
MQTYNAYWPRAHKDPVKMAKLGSAAQRLCGLDNVSLPFCMTVEAEAFGAPINFHEEMIKWPSITTFQVKEPTDLTIPQDVSTAGRIPVIIKAIKLLKKEYDGKVPINVYLAPPFTSISSYLVDSITFLKWLKIAPEKVHQFCKATIPLYIELAQLYEEAGADMITFHEMGASTDNISPLHFTEFVQPYLTQIVKQLKVPTILNICGSALMILDKMIDCDVTAIAVDERTPMKQARKLVDTLRLGYPIIGNISAYHVIHAGPPERIRQVVQQVIGEGVDMVAPGCDFWLETPTEHVQTFVEAVTESDT